MNYLKLLIDNKYSLISPILVTGTYNIKRILMRAFIEPLTLKRFNSEINK